MFNFTCRKCGCNELHYEKWVNCRIPVVYDSDHIEYDLSIVDEENELGGVGGFSCSCGAPIEFQGCRIQTEEELRDYLSLDPAFRESEQQKYDEYLQEIVEAEKEKEDEDEDEIIFEEKEMSN